jgi:pyridoxine kinase
MTSGGKARLFKIVFPAINCYFSGTGDMFGALMVVRLREAVGEAGLTGRTSWLSDDDVVSTDLPLAKAARKVLASMHEVLARTAEAMPKVMERSEAEIGGGGEEDEKKSHLVKSKAAELQLVRNLGCLQAPEVKFEVLALE